MQWRCPICRQLTDAATHADFPFCSARCRLIDLGNWAAEKYRASEPAPPPESGSPESDQPATNHDKPRSGS